MQKEWSFTGASGAEYVFTRLAKSEDMPQSPGVLVLAYIHLRGHLAGWQVNPLFIGHGEDMRSVLDGEVELEGDLQFIWNSNFVLSEPEAAAREACVRDLEAQGAKFC